MFFIVLVAAVKAFEPKVRPFRRTQALAILLAFVSNRQLHEAYPAQKLTVFTTTLAALLPELDEKRVARAKPRHLLSLFTILRGLKQHSGNSQLDWTAAQEKLTELAPTFFTSKQTPPVKKSFKKLLDYLELKVSPGAGAAAAAPVAAAATAAPIAAAMPGLADAAEVDNTGEKKKKKKKNKEALQRKKEKKLEAAAAQADEGVPSFAEFVVDSTEVFVPRVDKKKFKQKNKNKKRKNSENSAELSPVKKPKS